MSFRGPYRKMDTDETVGSDEEPMGREREIEVTGVVHREASDDLALRVLETFGLHS